MNCIKGYKIQVLSGNGYYIGTLDNEGLPMCRLSEEYYKKRADAESALNDGTFTQRNCVENDFCSDGQPCISQKGI
jgi:hypothetical protein